MEEPGGLQSMGSQRVGLDWATSQLRRYADYTILMAESGKELKSLLMKLKEERGECSLKTQHSHLVSSLHGKCVSVSHLVMSDPLWPPQLLTPQEVNSGTQMKTEQQQIYRKTIFLSDQNHPFYLLFSLHLLIFICIYRYMYSSCA